MIEKGYIHRVPEITLVLQIRKLRKETERTQTAANGTWPWRICAGRCLLGLVFFDFLFPVQSNTTLSTKNKVMRLFIHRYYQSLLLHTAQ